MLALLYGGGAAVLKARLNMETPETRSATSTRAGRYVAQPNGYRAFMAEVKSLIRTIYPAVNDLVARMVDLGILHEFTGQARNRKFIYQSYTWIFTDAESEIGT